MNNKLSNQKNIEIEFRAIFGENDFDRLKEYLDLSAENIGEDDKDVFFCITRFPAVFLPQDTVGKSENPRFSGILVS